MLTQRDHCACLRSFNLLPRCIILGALLVARGVSGCSNMLVSKGATTDGSTHIAYNSDGQVGYFLNMRCYAMTPCVGLDVRLRQRGGVVCIVQLGARLTGRDGRCFFPPPTPYNLQSFYGYMTSLPRATHPAGTMRDIHEFGW